MKHAKYHICFFLGRRFCELQIFVNCIFNCIFFTFFFHKSGHARLLRPILGRYYAPCHALHERASRPENDHWDFFIFFF